MIFIVDKFDLEWVSLNLSLDTSRLSSLLKELGFKIELTKGKSSRLFRAKDEDKLLLDCWSCLACGREMK